jgi:hypothetical protein
VTSTASSPGAPPTPAPATSTTSFGIDKDQTRTTPTPTPTPTPGQTHPDNLAPLCRGHHNIKTHGRWKYVRNRDGTYTWTSPRGQTYLVTKQGTVRLD